MGVVECLRFSTSQSVATVFRLRGEKEKQRKIVRTGIDFQVTGDTYIHVAIKHPRFFYGPCHCLPRTLFTVLHACTRRARAA